MSASYTSDNRNKLVLGVDDNAENLAFLKMTLEIAGYSFIGVASGLECVGTALRIRPRLILLDIQMPEFDGFATCRRLRSQAELREVPVAFVTARKTREDVREGMAAGGNDFLVKPYAREHLLARVQHWTSRRAALSSPVIEAARPAPAPGFGLSPIGQPSRIAPLGV
jgi:two-component system OmpR family response regulator